MSQEKKSFVTTDDIKCSGSEYVRELLSTWLQKRGILFIPVPLISIAAGFYNNAFFYLAAILMFIIYPFGLMMVYFNYALDKNISYLSLFRHSVTFFRDNITISFKPLTATDENGEEKIIKKAPDNITIPSNEIKNISFSGKYIVITGTHKNNIVLVPVSSFKSQPDFRFAEETIEKWGYLNPYR